MTDDDAVIAANMELYAAFEAGDVERIGALWDDADDLICVHPGWPPVRGRSRIMRSWAVIMANTAYIQFFGTGATVTCSGDVAVVSCEHSVLSRASDATSGLGETARVVDTNVFRRRDDRWRLWAHHGSPVVAVDDGEPGE